MKKIISILLAAICMFGYCSLAFAEDVKLNSDVYYKKVCDENGNLKYGIGNCDMSFCPECNAIVDSYYNVEEQIVYCKACNKSIYSNHESILPSDLAYGYICPVCGGFSGITHIYYVNEEDRINNPGVGKIRFGKCLHCDAEIGYVKDVKVYRFTSEKVKSLHIAAFENTEYMYGDGHDEKLEEIFDSNSGGIYDEWKQGYYGTFRYKVHVFFTNIKDWFICLILSIF